MQESHSHPGYVNVAKRLKRASGHLQNVIAMVESDRECIDIAQHGTAGNLQFPRQRRAGEATAVLQQKQDAK